MSAYAVSKFLFEYNKDAGLRERFGQDRADALAAYDLTEEERRALAGYDFKTLYDRGIPPLLLTALANGSGIPILAYFESIRTGAPVPAELVGTAFRGKR
jgi:hypothetical protein